MTIVSHDFESVLNGLEMAMERGDIISVAIGYSLTRPYFNVEYVRRYGPDKSAFTVDEAHAFLVGLMTGRERRK